MPQDILWAPTELAATLSELRKIPGGGGAGDGGVRVEVNAACCNTTSPPLDRCGTARHQNDVTKRSAWSARTLGGPAHEFEFPCTVHGADAIHRVIGGANCAKGSGLTGLRGRVEAPAAR
jgi:hypothetical protein